MTYAVDKAHRLKKDGLAVPFRQTPNGGGSMRPLYLVIHYTAGRDAESSIRWFENKDAQASAHLVVGRDGSVTQLQRFDRLCWHAGKSRWGEIEGLNAHSIGIEIDNAGVLDKTDAGAWRAWFGDTIPPEQVLVAQHRLGGPSRGWHIYTPEQIEIVMSVAAALHARYAFLDILGHDDISWPRKTDPGPAFPLSSLRSRVLGRA